MTREPPLPKTPQIKLSVNWRNQVLAIWNFRAAHDLAWDFADHLRNLGGVSRDLALEAQDKLTGVIGRSLLLPV